MQCSLTGVRYDDYWWRRSAVTGSWRFDKRQLMAIQQNSNRMLCARRFGSSKGRCAIKVQLSRIPIHCACECQVEFQDIFHKSIWIALETYSAVQQAPRILVYGRAIRSSVVLVSACRLCDSKFESRHGKWRIFAMNISGSLSTLKAVGSS